MGLRIEEKKEVQLVISRNDVLIRNHIGLRPPPGRQLQSWTYITSLPIRTAKIKTRGKDELSARIERKQGFSHVVIDLSRVPHQRAGIQFMLQLLLKPEVLDRLGSLNIINWPKEDLSAIFFLRGSGQLFFTSALASIEKVDNQGSIVLKPPALAKKLDSHGHKGSAIRVEWGHPSTIRFDFIYKVRNEGTNKVNGMQIRTALPPTTQFQRVKHQHNHEVEEDEDHNEWGKVSIPPLSPKESYEVKVTVDVKSTGNMNNILPNLGSFQKLRAIFQHNRDVARFIQESKYWNISDVIIQKAIQSLLKNSKTPAEYLRLAFEFVNQKIKYQPNNMRDTAANTIRKLTGVCSEFSDLLVALLRGGGIPAKIVHGLIIENDQKSLEHHAWVEYFSVEHGWIQCDPTWGYLSGVCSQHICRQREGLQSDLPTYSFSQERGSKISLTEEIRYRILRT